MQKQTRRKWLLGVGNAGVGLAAARPDKAERSALTRLPAVEVHAGGHLLQTEGGRPFFWLGDTDRFTFQTREPSGSVTSEHPNDIGAVFQKIREIVRIAIGVG